MKIKHPQPKTCEFGDISAGDVFEVRNGSARDGYYMRIDNPGHACQAVRLSSGILYLYEFDDVVIPVPGAFVPG